nr:hypothetical protein CPGR_06039 [Mycolicibacter nonchromogenicus]
MVVAGEKIETNSRKSKVPPEPLSLELTTYTPITAASMIRPPNRLYSRNFRAAWERFAPLPNPPIMKYIGISIASKNT